MFESHLSSVQSTLWAVTFTRLAAADLITYQVN